MPEQCKAAHPKSPSPDIFLCVRELGHTDDHYTYNFRGTNIFWSTTTTTTED